MRRNILTVLSALLLLFAFAGPAAAAQLQITITNTAHSSYFTPLLIAAHSSRHTLFQAGTAASADLQAMAEGGDISGLTATATAAGADVSANPAGGLLGPGQSTTLNLATSTGNDLLSITAMILPTNDGFVGLDSLMLPTSPGTYTYHLDAYDAGTEANNELIVAGSGAPGVPGIPADPTGLAGSGGSGVTNLEVNDRVHIHRGVLGEESPAGNVSDLVNTVHRWLNPIAELVVVVQ